MKKMKIALLAALAALAIPTATVAQGVPSFHVVNDLGIWFYSINSAQEAMAVCQVNTQQGYACYYKGYW